MRLLETSEHFTIIQIQIAQEEPITVLEPSDLELEADERLEQGNIELAESNYNDALTIHREALDVYKTGHTYGMINVTLMMAKYIGSKAT